MALAVYKETVPGFYKEITKVTDELENFPIITVHDGKVGDSVELKLYVRADDIKVYYSSITAYPENLGSTNYLDGTSTGWGMKLRAGYLQPTESEWEDIAYGNTITLDNIGNSTSGNTSVYLPFWVRVECPAHSPIREKEATCITLSYTENLIEAEHWR